MSGDSTTSGPTLTVRLDAKLKEKLDRLSAVTGRSRSALAAEAVAAYVAHETEIIGGIHRGLTDLTAGRLVPHEEAMAEVCAAIDVVARHPE